jgi:MYXO-CTERM domain-containing protein
MFDELAEVLLTALGASPLGASAASALSGELATRSILPKCRRVREWTGTPIRGGAVTLAYSIYSTGRRPMPLPDNAAYAPGPFQVHVPLAPNTVSLRVEMRDIQATGATGGGGGGMSVPYTPAALARFALDPISFGYDPELTSNALDPVNMTKAGNRYSAELDVPAGATEAFVMIVNMGDQSGLYTDLQFTMVEGEPDAGGVAGSGGSAGTPAEDAGISGEAGTLSADPGKQLLEPKGGCTCRSAGGRGGSPNILLLAGLGALLFRRRTARC